MDAQTMGVLTATAMEHLSTVYEPVEDAYVRTIALVIEVDRGDPTDFHVFSNEDRCWVQKELLGQAIDSLDCQHQPVRDDEDE